MLSVAAGVPALEAFPIDAYRRSMDRALKRDVRLAWGHSPTEGLPVLRDAIAQRFGGQSQNVLVLAGAQQGLDLLARCLIDPGDTVVVDRPGYLGALHTFNAAGARIVGWDVVRHDLDELEDLILRFRPKLIYTNPTFQNPTGWTMPLKLRRQLLSLATRLRVPIIEDDTYRELHLGTPPPPSLHSLDTQSVVIHLNTFSKVLAPGLRLGWLSAAPPIIEQLALLKQRSDPHMANLNQLIVADMLADGTFDRHLADLRIEHRRRRDAVVSALERHRREGAPAVDRSRRRPVLVVPARRPAASVERRDAGPVRFAGLRPRRGVLHRPGRRTRTADLFLERAAVPGRRHREAADAGHQYGQAGHGVVVSARRDCLRHRNIRSAKMADSAINAVRHGA